MDPNRTLHLVLMAALGSAACVACESSPATDAGHLTGAPSCDRTITACHPFDIGFGEASECHDVAHDSGDEATCAPQVDRCVAICEALATDGGAEDAGFGSDGGATDSGAIDGGAAIDGGTATDGGAADAGPTDAGA